MLASIGGWIAGSEEARRVQLVMVLDSQLSLLPPANAASQVHRCGRGVVCVFGSSMAGLLS